MRYISIDNPERALAFGQLLIDKTRMLGQFPEIGRVVPEIDDAVIREIIVHRYRVIYRFGAGGSQVEVIRFWHAARGTPSIPAIGQD